MRLGLSILARNAAAGGHLEAVTVGTSQWLRLE